VARFPTLQQLDIDAVEVCDLSPLSLMTDLRDLNLFTLQASPAPCSGQSACDGLTCTLCTAVSTCAHVDMPAGKVQLWWPLWQYPQE